MKETRLDRCAWVVEHCQLVYTQHQYCADRTTCRADRRGSVTCSCASRTAVVMSTTNRRHPKIAREPSCGVQWTGMWHPWAYVVLYCRCWRASGRRRSDIARLARVAVTAFSTTGCRSARSWSFRWRPRVSPRARRAPHMSSDCDPIHGEALSATAGWASAMLRCTLVTIRAARPPCAVPTVESRRAAFVQPMHTAVQWSSGRHVPRSLPTLQWVSDAVSGGLRRSLRGERCQFGALLESVDDRVATRLYSKD
jgi:hypothetical protein